MISIFILATSILFQFIAVVLAVRLIRITGKRLIWILIVVMVVLMAMRRGISLFGYFGLGLSQLPDLISDSIALIISGCMVIAIACTARLFRELRCSKAALLERAMLAELSADIGNSLIKQDELRSVLNACAEALVRHLDVAFARIWTLNAAENVLEMQASAGMYTRTDGSHSRVPVGKFKIGVIAEERKPLISNAVIGDPLVQDQEWAKQEGMVAFAGHPLIIEGRLVGVMAMFSRNPLSDVTLKALSSVSNDIAIGIERKRGEEKLHRMNRELRAISNCNQVLVRAEGEQTLLDDICRIVCDEAAYRMAWVGFVESDHVKSIRPVAWAGVEEGYLANAGITWADTERGQGPSGIAIRTGMTDCIQDFATDPKAAPWRDIAIQRGYRSSISLPLTDQSAHTFGVLNIYSAEPDAFTPEEIRLLEELSGDLAFGIMILRARIERKLIEEERLAHLHFVESMDHVNRAILGTNDLEQLMSDVLDAVLAIFDCDRAWLLYPCDPDAAWWSVPMERTKPEYPGANVQGLEIPMDPEVQRIFRTQSGTDGPVSYGPGCDCSYPEWLTEQFGVQSQLGIAACPRTGKPWMFGMHQCSHARIWTQVEKQLFQEINRRLADGLTTLLSHRDLLESEAKYRRIVDTASEGIWTIEPDAKISFVNARMVQMLGYSPEEMIGRSITDFMLKEEVSDHWIKIDNRRKGLSENYERRFRRKDGETVWTIVSAAPILDDDHNYKGSTAMSTDITGQKELENQLFQAQKMEAIGQLAGGIAHDFNNILTAIIGFSTLIEMHMTKDDPQRKNMSNVLAASNRAAELTKSLLTFSRKQVFNLQPTDLNQVIANIDAFLKRVIGEDIHLITTFQKEHLVINADSGQIEQVLMNLATNARDAMPNGGVLSLETKAVMLESELSNPHGNIMPGEYALVTITDSGAGMDETVCAKLFEPFFTTKEAGKGTGLGMAIVYGIIKQHNGNICVQSERGVGTTFTIYLPLIGEALKERMTDVVVIPEPGVETVLVADDDELVRNFLGEILRQFGYTVITATDGADALRRFSENRETIALVLMDIIMPNMNGKEALEEIRKIRPDIKSIFISGYTAGIINSKGIIEDGEEILAKPVKPMELLNNVRKVLEKAANIK